MARAGEVADSRGHKNWHICSQIGLAGLVSCLLFSSPHFHSLLYLFLLKNSNSAQCRFVSGRLAKWRVINTRGLLNLKQSDSSFMATLLPSPLLACKSSDPLSSSNQTRLDSNVLTRLDEHSSASCGLPIPTQKNRSRKGNWKSKSIDASSNSVCPVERWFLQYNMHWYCIKF